MAVTKPCGDFIDQHLQEGEPERRRLERDPLGRGAETCCLEMGKETAQCA